MYLKGWQITQKIEEKAPVKYAVEEDNVGLQLGSIGKEVKKCLLALDVTEDVIQEGIQIGAELIISHHPLFFQPLKSLDIETGLGNIIARAIKNDICIYSAHTNLDVAPKIGVNSTLADRFELKNRQILQPVHEENYLKLVLFVPEGYEKEVKEAVFSQGAGWIGNYSNTGFISKGKGSFKPMEGTAPYIGSEGQTTEVDEVKFETILPESLTKPVIEAIKSAHPYEEPAYDLYPLNNAGKPTGLGLIGEFEEGLETGEFIQKVKANLMIDNIRVIGKEPHYIKKVALCGGSGERLIEKAMDQGADVFITGDVKYHGALEACEKDFFVIDAGHYETELPVLEKLKGYLEAELGVKYKTEFCITKKQKNPFVYY